jgi:hypothetical protein
MLTDQESSFATAFISSISLFAGKPPLHKEPASSLRTFPLNPCFQAILRSRDRAGWFQDLGLKCGIRRAKE